MAIIEGTRAMKTYVGEWDFAVDGGAVSTIVLRSPDGPLPNGAVVEGGYIEVDTLLTTAASGTGALQIEAANDIQTAIIVTSAPWSTTGRKSITPAFTGATVVKATAARSPAFVIATGALTAGKFRLVVFYR